MTKLPFVLFLAISLCIEAAAYTPPPAGSSIVFPAPARSGECLSFVFRAADAGSAKLLVYNEKGSLVATQASEVVAGLQTIRLCSCFFAPGVYVYRIRMKPYGGSEESTGGKFAVIH